MTAPETPAPQRIRFVRDTDGDLWIEIPGQPGQFASVNHFKWGSEYVKDNSYVLERLETSVGPMTIEWDSAAP